MNVKATPFNSFAFVSMAALAISGGSLVACQLNYERKSYPFQLICICQHGCSCNLWWFFSCLPIAL
ncbi:hypothetical protein ACX8ZS_19965 [Acinetobacter baumannii]